MTDSAEIGDPLGSWPRTQTDIVERLRDAGQIGYVEDARLMQEAADEIERLRQQLDEERKEYRQQNAELLAALKKIIRLNPMTGRLEQPQTTIARAAIEKAKP